MFLWFQSLLGLVSQYCVACRAHAKIRRVADEDIETPVGRRRIRRGVCRDCGSETSQFVASA
jgi:ribosomal protein S26